MRGINTFCSPLPGSAVAPLQLQLQLLPGAGEGDAPARKDAREGIRRGKRMLRQRHGATAAPEYQRYHRSLRRTHGALEESIGAAPGREGSTTARGEPGGARRGRGSRPTEGGRWIPRDAQGELPRDRGSRDGAAGMDPLRRLWMVESGRWDGRHEPAAPPDPSAKLSPPPSRRPRHG